VIDHDKTKEEFSKIKDKCEHFKLPFFASEDTGDYILKVKTKFINGFDDLSLKEKYQVNVQFEGYNYNNNVGYYAKMDQVKPTTYNKPSEIQKIINIFN